MRKPIFEAMEFLETVCAWSPRELEALALIRQELDENTATMLRMDSTIHDMVKAREKATADFLTRGENV